MNPKNSPLIKLQTIKPKIAVLLASYNGERHIELQLSSIVNQIGVELDVYISDDGSTDNTLNIIGKYELSNVKIIKSKDKASGPGYNFLNLIEVISADGYDFISFSDQDDLWFSNKLIEGLTSMRDNASDAYSSNVVAYWSDRKQSLIDKALPQKEYDFVFESAGPGCTFILSKLLYCDLRKYLLLNDSIKRKVWMHDWFIYAFARGRGYSWYIDKNPYMYYRQHPSNLLGANFSLNSAITRVKLVSSGLYKAQCNLIMDHFVKDESFLYPFDGANLFHRIRFLFHINKCRRKFLDRISLAALVLLYFF